MVLSTLYNKISYIYTIKFKLRLPSIVHFSKASKLTNEIKQLWTFQTIIPNASHINVRESDELKVVITEAHFSFDLSCLPSKKSPTDVKADKMADE